MTEQQCKNLFHSRHGRDRPLGLFQQVTEAAWSSSIPVAMSQSHGHAGDLTRMKDIGASRHQNHLQSPVKGSCSTNNVDAIHFRHCITFENHARL